MKKKNAAKKFGRVHACINGQADYNRGKLYLFRDSVYYRYDWESDKVDKGYPLSIRLWDLPESFEDGIDASLEGVGPWADKAYFFSGSEYVAYDWARDKLVEKSLRPLIAWPLPGVFSQGVEAAINGQGPCLGKAYFFKGDQYISYDWATRAVEGPASVSLWNFPIFFRLGIDAAVNGLGQYQGKAYFFKRDKFLRYNWADNTVDYSKTLQDGWAELHKVLRLDPTHASFYNTYIEDARESERLYQIPALVTLAQSGLESGWATQNAANNMFGIKAGKDWTGKKKLMKTKEVFPSRKDAPFPDSAIISVKEVKTEDPPQTMYEYTVMDWFRAYDHPRESFKGHADFLWSPLNPQFKGAFAYKDPYRFAEALANARYATTPPKQYYAVLKDLIDSFKRIAPVVELP